MKILTGILRVFLAIFKTLRLSLPKLGVGWMFALLTINFNRIAIVELGIAAILVTSILGLHYFLSPFQVICGRIADLHPIFGYRRTPYYLFGAVMASLVFVALPSIAEMMGQGLVQGFVLGIGLLIIYGISIAFMGDSHHSLIAEVTEPKNRGGVIAVVQTFMIFSTIVASIVMNIVMPEYTPAAQQQLYNLTPFIVIGAALLGFIGMEKRLKGDELTRAVEKARLAAPPGNPLSSAWTVLKTDKHARRFFAFVSISILAIFLQDKILEVFGAEVFGMSVQETTKFQQIWGGGVLLGMIGMGLISVLLPVQKKHIAIGGGIGTSAGMFLLAYCGFTEQVSLLNPALITMGLFTGFFNVGALSMMMDMTVEGATGLYMGLWGVGQAVGNGLASFGSGALHTALIGSGLLTPTVAYFSIFSVEAVLMLVGVALISRVSIKAFHARHDGRFAKQDFVTAIEAGATA